LRIPVPPEDRDTLSIKNKKGGPKRLHFHAIISLDNNKELLAKEMDKNELNMQQQALLESANEQLKGQLDELNAAKENLDNNQW